MKAAVVKGAGQPPVYEDFDRPNALAGHHLIDVTASALSRITRSKAAGSHYSASGAFPFVAGVDGTGRLEDGQRVYFFAPHAPFGALAERTLVPEANCIPLPVALDDVTAAAIAIPGMSSWAALTERARFVRGETVLVNGATGASGRLAVQIAKHLGAGRIIATGRNPTSLESLKRAGADFTISLEQDESSLSRAFESHFRQGVDVVLDYLWGPSARSLLIAAAKASADAYPVRFVQIGAISGADIVLPAAVLRATAITLLGSGIGSVTLPRLLHAVKEVLDATVPAGLQIATEAVPLADLNQHWESSDSQVRTVFTLR
ncbi:L-threonine 3-dehydrogenase [Paraburkholderia nemoris]|uniref:quinone oxidoreductase family protein n=1 Tax=Paraburkholderia nemoris TaxID=2793076 RepID=UPI00190CD8F6|nr:MULTISPECIES: zinc-binding alcohol dehydrogenase family protein [Paraburkholderia]MBK3779629.1 zinc-binding alcohol dehydrogenase family protein [Paraburkholderia aspalathi]MBK5146769.1 zinc-binding alcohol dehydrogenase family protein [Burkholderia sp. R-69608]CAE6690410.1 L-threonine 3-dehydrogenase [Paraburkholderia nemoris]CAE6869496.1 L-threonine 3-dehydrogenase [Paraburkholderia nemoris]